MDPINYYITTLITAFKNLAPTAAFLIGGYFIFIKLPFLFLKKNLNDQKKKLDIENQKDSSDERYTIEQYQEFQKRMRLMNVPKEEERKESSAKRNGNERIDNSRKEEKKREEKKDQKKEEKRQEKRSPSPASKIRSPEEIFSLKSGENLSGADLKRRYFELLKQNHPDRVASMGADFKTLAEKNTKEINKAYESLKKKAS
jgi:DnaJ-domain-containing protein 1